MCVCVCVCAKGSTRRGKVSGVDGGLVYQIYSVFEIIENTLYFLKFLTNLNCVFSSKRGHKKYTLLLVFFNNFGPICAYLVQLLFFKCKYPFLVLVSGKSNF